MAVCDKILFITTPDYPTLAATVKAGKFAKFRDIDILGIVVNRKKGRMYELNKKDISDTAKIPVVCEIKEDHKNF